MTVHFRQGVYKIRQDDREVGRLVALDATSTRPATEHFFLYQNVSTTDAVYRTYTTPSRSGAGATDDTFHQATDVEWVIVPVAAVEAGDFDPSHYLSDLLAEVGSLVTVEPITAEETSPCETEEGQIWWGEYELQNSHDEVIGSLSVSSDGLNETWYLKKGKYTTPSPLGGAVVIKFRFLSAPAPREGIKFCVKSSAPTVVG